MRKLTIGIDGNEANVKNRVGSGIYAFEMIREFSKNSQHQFIVYLKEKSLPDLPKDGTNFRYIVFGPKKLWTRLALPIKLSFDQKTDIFFTLGHYGPHFSKVPYTVTIFDLSYLHYPEMFKKDDLYQLTNWSRYSIKNSKHIFTISKSSKDDIVKNYHVNQSKVTVTYMGYDKERFKPQPASKIQKVKIKYKIKGDYLIFVGTLQPRKNIEQLIEAFNQVIKLSGNQAVRRTKSENPMTRVPEDLQLVVAGKKGWLYGPIFEKVKELGLEKKVIFTDYVADEDLPCLISGAKAYVLPSLWEGFGIPAIEAQACGVPVVVSNTSSLPEIVGESGILVDPQSVDSVAQGIIKVLTDHQTRSDLAKAGFENIKRFSWQTCAEQTLEVLEKLASS